MVLRVNLQPLEVEVGVSKGTRVAVNVVCIEKYQASGRLGDTVKTVRTDARPRAFVLIKGGTRPVTACEKSMKIYNKRQRSNVHKAMLMTIFCAPNLESMLHWLFGKSAKGVPCNSSLNTLYFSQVRSNTHPVVRVDVLLTGDDFVGNLFVTSGPEPHSYEVIGPFHGVKSAACGVECWTVRVLRKGFDAA